MFGKMEIHYVLHNDLNQKQVWLFIVQLKVIDLTGDSSHDERQKTQTTTQDYNMYNFSTQHFSNLALFNTLWQLKCVSLLHILSYESHLASNICHSAPCSNPPVNVILEISIIYSWWWLTCWSNHGCVSSL